MPEGMTQRQVADDLGVNQSVICSVWNPFQKHGNVFNCHWGCQRLTSQHDERFLRILARQHPFATANQLHSEIMIASGVNVSTQTIRNRMHDTGWTKV